MTENIYLPLFTHYHLTEKVIHFLDCMVTHIHTWMEFSLRNPTKGFYLVCVSVCESEDPLDDTSRG